ncbi:hypothetical protein APT59_17905 [Pseudomonas oryzihabitans]|uniref:Uncharacterized protein n=1 Tax=Pseudomonas oryzihabitans TaxID=47885 RepID=A0A0U4WUT6_9PSED|nr:hypothetical protein APT59_17905 [Pseudomonas oryzihabitans]
MGDHVSLDQHTTDIRSKWEGVWSGGSDATITAAKICCLDSSGLVQHQSRPGLGTLAKDEAAIEGIGNAAVQKSKMR